LTETELQIWTEISPEPNGGGGVELQLTFTPACIKSDCIKVAVYACLGSYDEFAVKRIEVNPADLPCKHFYHI